MAKRLGELLIEGKVITQEQLDHALTLQRGDGRKLGQMLVELKMATETQLTQALSKQLAVPWVLLYHVEFSRSLLNFVPREIAEKYTLIPVHVRKTKKNGEELFVAMDDPTNEGALAEVAKHAGISVKPMIASPSDIKEAIRVYYAGGAAASQPNLADASAAAPPPAAKPPPKPPKPPPSRASLPDATEAAPPSAERPPAATHPDVPVARAAAAAATETASEPPEPIEPLSEDHPDAAPEIEATETEIEPKSRRSKPGQRMVALTFLDGTTLQVPAAKKRLSEPSIEPSPEEARPKESAETLTARDLISALRAVAHGADATEILGERPPGWEAMFAALLALMLRKGLIADWEFIEEFRKI